MDSSLKSLNTFIKLSIENYRLLMQQTLTFQKTSIDQKTQWKEKSFKRLLWFTCLYILNKSWRQHPTRHQIYGHLPPVTKTIQVRRTRKAGHCWRSKDELISDVLLWTPAYGQAKAERPARTYIQQLCEDTGCSPEDLPEVMNDREKWRDRVRDIRASGTTWWWWYIYILLKKKVNWFLSVDINNCNFFVTTGIIKIYILTVFEVFRFLKLINHDSFTWRCMSQEQSSSHMTNLWSSYIHIYQKKVHIWVNSFVDLHSPQYL